MEKKELTSSQQKGIVALIECNSVEEAAKRIRVNKSTIYNWLKQDRFKNQLEAERAAVFREGLEKIKGATTNAAGTLIDLLKSKDENSRRLAAQKILDFALKIVEFQDFEERISRIEEILEQNQYKH